MPPPVLRAQDKLRLEVGEEGWVEREGVVEVVEWASTRRRFSSSSSRQRRRKVEEEQCFRLCLWVRRLGKPAHGARLLLRLLLLRPADTKKKKHSTLPMTPSNTC